MQRSTRLFIGLAGAVLALSGCPPTYPKCDTDAHCKEHGEVCVQGQCKECATDANCKAGFVCDANKCVPKPECVGDSGCGPGKKCKGGKCAVGTDQAANACTSNQDCPSGQECKEGFCSSKTTSSCDFSPIRFDFNEAKLSSQATSTLSQVADCIKKQKLKVTLEGHADDRGTEEYNLQLSNRRAASVKRYLLDLGVNNGDLETVGYGENKPAMNGQSEEAWAANRRVEFNKR